MRIALVSQEYPPETAKGGLGTQTFLKAHGMAALGHEVHVISRSTNAERTEKTVDGVNVIRIASLDSRFIAHTEIADWLTHSTAAAAEVAALHARRPLDVVDFAEWGAEGCVHLLNRTEWNRIPTVVQLHGPLVMFTNTMNWPEMNSEFYRMGTAMESACVRLADAVFSSSRCSAEWCAKHYGLVLDQTPIIHTGVDTEFFRPQSAPKANRPTIIFTGKLAANKGVHLLVEAASKLANEFPCLHLRLLGRGDPKIVSELQSRAKSAGYPDLLDLPGFVSREDLPAQLSRAHVFAAPSQYEGGPGFVYLEAMACGLPVIACAGSGAAEVVRHNETGWLVPPLDVAALTDTLRNSLKNQTQREAMGAKARDFVVAEMDSRRMLRQLESFYAAAAAGKHWVEAQR